MREKRWPQVATLLLVAGLAAAGLFADLASSRPPALAGDGKEVHVAYPGALARVVEDKLREPFERATGCRLLGESKGSVAMANLIKDRIRYPDVLLGSDRQADLLLAGARNGGYVSWWVPFARSELVIAWNPSSRFSGAFEEAKEGARTVESVLVLPGLRLGRTDPELDPRGYRTLFLFQLDEARTGTAGLARAVLGSDRNPEQIFPEEILGARVQSGAVDAGVFYATEPIVAGLPFLTLPPEINQGDPAMEPAYAKASYRLTDGRTVRGSAIAYTATIPATARNAAGANAFVRFLLGPRGQELLAQQGLVSLPGEAEGDRSRVPPAVASVLTPPAPLPPPDAGTPPQTGAPMR